MPSAEAMALASHEIASAQQRRVAIQKRFALPMREIWAMQPRLERRQGKRPLVLLSHPRFRAAYDFLLLRAEAGETDPELAQWWTRFQDVDAAERVKMLGGSAARKRKRRKRKPKTNADRSQPRRRALPGCRRRPQRRRLTGRPMTESTKYGLTGG